MTFLSNRWSIIAVLLAAGAAVCAAADPPDLVARLNVVQGPVSVRLGSLDDWAPAELNYPLTIGDHVWADDGGRAEMHVGSAALRVDGRTDVSFLNIDDQTVQLSVTQGSVNVRLRSMDPGDVFEIDVPNAVVTLVQPGSYTINVTDASTLGITVRGGQAQVSAAGNDFDVPSGQTATVIGSSSVGWYLQPSELPGEWEQWCASRDAHEDTVASSRYVSRDMTGYEDLDEYGTWTVVPGYGPAWTPQNVPIGWAPYKYGRWAWVAPWGWTWVDDAPWGFAPFHYGRWAFVGNRWVWVPGAAAARPVYAPALVVFVGAGPEGDPNSGDVGWFPLGPQELYVPPYEASPAYVQRSNVTQVNNITITTIEQTNVTRVTYVNRSAPYAMTVVPRQTFQAGRPAQSSAVPFTMNQARNAPVVGMAPTVVPQRESILGQRAGTGAPVRQPPPQVMDRPVFGRTAPAPAPTPFMVPQQAPPPVTIYRRPPAPAAAPAPRPVRPQQPILINPGNRPQGFPPQPQPAQPQPGRAFAPQEPVQPQPQPIRPQPQPAQPQPQPQPGRAFAPQPARPGQPVQPLPVQPRPQQPQQPQPQQPPQVGPGTQQGRDNQGRDNQGRDNQDRGQQQPVQQPQVGPGRPQPAPQPVQPAQPQQPSQAGSGSQGRDNQDRGQPQPAQQPQVGPGRPQPVQPQPQPQAQPAQPKPQPQQPPQSSLGSAQGRGQAQSFLNEVKTKTLPGVQGQLESARKNPAVKLDYASLTNQINAASKRLAALQSGLTNANADATLKEAQSLQSQLDGLGQQISQAVQSAAGADTNQRGGPSGQPQPLGGKGR